MEMKSSNKNKFGKSSIQSIIRLAQIYDQDFNEIFPNTPIQKTENIKKFKKKKQTNIKRVNTKQNHNKEGNTNK